MQRLLPPRGRRWALDSQQHVHRPSPHVYTLRRQPPCPGSREAQAPTVERTRPRGRAAHPALLRWNPEIGLWVDAHARRDAPAATWLTTSPSANGEPVRPAVHASHLASSSSTTHSKFEYGVLHGVLMAMCGQPTRTSTSCSLLALAFRTPPPHTEASTLAGKVDQRHVRPVKRLVAAKPRGRAPGHQPPGQLWIIDNGANLVAHIRGCDGMRGRVHKHVVEAFERHMELAASQLLSSTCQMVCSPWRLARRPHCL